MEYEATSARPLHRHHLADEYNVVARLVARVVPAFEPRDATVDQWSVGPAEAMHDPGEPIGMGTRKATCEIDLPGGEHVHRVALRGVERGEAAGTARDRP